MELIDKIKEIKELKKVDQKINDKNGNYTSNMSVLATFFPVFLLVTIVLLLIFTFLGEPLDNSILSEISFSLSVIIIFCIFLWNNKEKKEAFKYFRDVREKYDIDSASPLYDFNKVFYLFYSEKVNDLIKDESNIKMALLKLKENDEVYSNHKSLIIELSEKCRKRKSEKEKLDKKVSEELASYTDEQNLKISECE